MPNYKMRTMDTKGGEYTKWKVFGAIDVADANNPSQGINIDNFEGSGETYKQRHTPLITIRKEGFTWEGTIEELVKKLNGLS